MRHLRTLNWRFGMMPSINVSSLGLFLLWFFGLHHWEVDGWEAHTLLVHLKFRDTVDQVVNDALAAVLEVLNKQLMGKSAVFFLNCNVSCLSYDLVEQWCLGINSKLFVDGHQP